MMLSSVTVRNVTNFILLFARNVKQDMDTTIKISAASSAQVSIRIVSLVSRIIQVNQHVWSALKTKHSALIEEDVRGVRTWMMTPTVSPVTQVIAVPSVRVATISTLGTHIKEFFGDT